MKIVNFEAKFSLNDFGFGYRPKPSEVYNLGPYFQGVLMEKIDTKVAEALHMGSTNPYAQGLYLRGDEIVWRLRTTEEYSESLISPFMDSIDDHLYLKALDKKVKMVEQKKEMLDIDFGEIFYSESALEKFTIRFLTPTAFKQAGRYVFLPDLRLVLGSLARKYEVLVDNKEGDVEEDFLDSLAQASYITAYNLNSIYMRIERANIPSMLGTITFKVRGANTLKNYIHMLLVFGSCFGVGIKNSMGMGMMELKDAR